MSQEKKFSKTKNPNQVKNVDWSKYSFEDICYHVGSATEIPETKVDRLGCNPVEGKEDKWEKYTEVKKGTEAMQTYYGTDYTYSQGKDFIEKSGYKLKMMAVENGYEGYVVRVDNAKEKSTKTAAGKLSLDELFAIPAKASRQSIYIKEETLELLKKMEGDYPWGVKGKVEAELLARAMEEYAERHGYEK